MNPCIGMILRLFPLCIVSVHLQSIAWFQLLDGQQNLGLVVVVVELGFFQMGRLSYEWLSYVITKIKTTGSSYDDRGHFQLGEWLDSNQNATVKLVYSFTLSFFYNQT